VARRAEPDSLSSPPPPSRAADAHARRFTRFLEQALDQPDAPLHTLELVLPERQALLERWNDTAAPYPEHLCIHQLFEQQVRLTPDAIALVCDDESLTFAQLNARANRLAHHLIALGVRPEDRVALCMERGIGAIVALFAILKAGGAYIPLDPAYPGERLGYILSDVAPLLLVADAAGRQALGDTGALAVLDPNASLDNALPQDDPFVPGLASHHLAYAIYTSGSTGKPKGVMVEHRHVLNLHHALHSTVFAHCAPHSSVTLNASIAFDASVQNLTALLSGHRLVIISADVRTDAMALIEFLDTAGIDVFDCTPTQLESLFSAGLLEQRQSALTVLGDFVPDLLLLDIGLPGMNGYEVAKQVRSRPDLHGVRLVALSGYGSEADRRSSVAAGFDAHFIKPIEFSSIQTLLSTL